jgi:hypothetical protein
MYNTISTMHCATSLAREIHIETMVLILVVVEQGKPEITGGTKHFMAFGGGLRFCVGTDLTKVLMATFIHNLVTKYRYGVSPVN